MATDASTLASSGIEGLDHLLGGGYPTRRMHLVEGVPGTGKTTLALQFLLAARDRGERTLYVTLSETAEELAAVADSHGWSLDAIEIQQLAPVPNRAAEEYTLYHPAEVESRRSHEDRSRARGSHAARLRGPRFALGAPAPGT